MGERNPFERKPETGNGSIHCEQWEEMLADALDGALSTADRAAFDAHAATCPTCSQLLAQSTQGREWLRFLEEEPEIPAGLVERIVSRTSGSVAAGGRVPSLGVGGATQVPALATGQGLAIPVRRAAWDSHVVMTAAMAFFSLALTLNLMLSLAGVRLTNLNVASLNPANLEMNLTRQFYGVKGSVVRYYDNLRLVYEVESRVRQLRRADETGRTPKQVPANPKASNGASLSNPAPIPNLAPEDGMAWSGHQMAGFTAPSESGKSLCVKPEADNTTKQEEARTMKEMEASNATLAELMPFAQAERSLA